MRRRTFAADDLLTILWGLERLGRLTGIDLDIVEAAVQRVASGAQLLDGERSPAECRSAAPAANAGCLVARVSRAGAPVADLVARRAGAAADAFAAQPPAANDDERLPLLCGEDLPAILAFAADIARTLAENGCLRCDSRQLTELLRLAARAAARDLLAGGQARPPKALVRARESTRIAALEADVRHGAEIIDGLPCIVYSFDEQGRLRGWNRTFREVSGYAEEELALKPLREFIADDGFGFLAASLAASAGSSDARTEAQFLTRQGERIPYLFTVRCVPGADGGLKVGIGLNIAERKQAEALRDKLTRALRLLGECNAALLRAETEQALIDEVCQLIVSTGGYRMAWVGYAESDENRNVCPVSFAGSNDGFLDGVRILWEDSELGRGPTGTAIRSGVAQVCRSIAQNPACAPWLEAARQRDYVATVAIPLLAEQRAFGSLGIYSSDPDSFAGDEVALLNDLASNLAYGIQSLRSRARRDAAERQLAFLAHHDPLTGLPNRVLLRQRFAESLAAAEIAGSGMALFYLDLDSFKQVNDSFGHDVGDRLLVALVARLQSCLRHGDLVGRYDSDAFVGVLIDAGDPAIIDRQMNTLLDAVAAPLEIAGHTLHISCCAGISRYPDDGTDFDTLLRKADAALCHAKDSAPGVSRFFESRMSRDALALMQIQSRLRQALAQEKFILHFQPQIDVIANKVVGFEALVRWIDENGELVPPGSFIAAAEESGLIVPLGKWVLGEACRQGREWLDAGLPQFSVAVNMSAQQFKHGGILETVAEVLTSTGFPAGLLELELTESILLQDTELVMQTLGELKLMGVKLSIDDFGTGYSSLSYLKRLAVDKLKIDQSFVRDLGESADDSAIVRAIIQLGHTLQLSVIAEGVETDRQLAFLRSFGCNQAQGYLFSRPLPAEDIPDYVLQRASVS
ncbi:sensor domain-containing protein [Rhodocyclus tenuis]|uniref:Diguanylate cyclase (GGDEF)-like protein/PAS domain S-box-containing protein n=1 Tax=Rhodocyclus tenuis TaxID=1066 RepID=A0A840G9Q1_RHOTE|nr:EAL domain-containing protein [Rhodocyclus tenuis]MBB4247408.1 diguanylate cyclase (GGDEF)-like protein/PAS domain S-box-containing protein [Rhodocyclus tenuis]